jgi:hypothetical protein
MTALRRWLANKLAVLARRIYPESEEVMAFHMDRMVEMVLTGKSTIKITHVDDSPHR